MENGNWACSFGLVFFFWVVGFFLFVLFLVLVLCCSKMTEKQQRIPSGLPQLWREEGDGNLNFRYCNFGVEREFHIRN